MVLLQDTALASLYLIFGQSTHLQHQHVMEYFKYLILDFPENIQSAHAHLYRQFWMLEPL